MTRFKPCGKEALRHSAHGMHSSLRCSGQHRMCANHLCVGLTRTHHEHEESPFCCGERNPLLDHGGSGSRAASLAFAVFWLLRPLCIPVRCLQRRAQRRRNGPFFLPETVGPNHPKRPAGGRPHRQSGASRRDSALVAVRRTSPPKWRSVAQRASRAFLMRGFGPLHRCPPVFGRKSLDRLLPTARSHSNSTSTCPLCTGSPTATFTRSTLPATGEVIDVSIFIASSIISTSFA